MVLNNKKEVVKVNLVLQLEIKILLVQTLSVNTHTSVLFFSTEGLVYKVKAWKIPEGSHLSKGKSLFNILPLKNHQSISSIMPCLKMKLNLKIIK